MFVSSTFLHSLTIRINSGLVSECFPGVIFNSISVAPFIAADDGRTAKIGNRKTPFWHLSV